MPVEKRSACGYCQRDMLEDRNYMRRPSFGPQRSATVGLIITIIAAFIVQQILQRSSSFQIDTYLALSLSGLKQGYVWQFLSFQFLHGGWLHLAGNCLVIF